VYQQIPTGRLTARQIPAPAENIFLAEDLTNEAETEVLDFLSQRPLHTVAMTGFIRDNGLVSPDNRGTFYGVRNDKGELEGVALIGHATLMETRTQRALFAFANVAQESSGTHMILGEQDCIQEFWSFYEGQGQQMRLATRESLFELRWPIAVYERVPALRLATIDEVDLILPVQAQMAYDESGVDPLEKDPDGFRKRCQRRIEQKRTWLLIEDGELLFKADVISETSEVVYLEGIWVNDRLRGTGRGVRCMSHLTNELLQRSQSISLLVDEKNKRAQAFYKKCGFKFLTTYDTIFLEQDATKLN
jgi:ribosomal protein S18 acetylase RimI-like enzyme